ncbi:MAG: FkbM family methyltransferase [Gemmataceae bacterium]
MSADTLTTRLRPDWVDPAGVTGGHIVQKIARRLLPVPARWALARLRWDAVDGVKTAAESARMLGWPAVAQMRWADLAGEFSRARRMRSLRLPGYPHPLFYREGSSDPHVMEQVFGRREYECVANETDVRFIVDCGANVGYTTAMLLHRYPLARVAVVEPDSGNLLVCRKNLAPFGDRVSYFQAGIWGSTGPMAMDRTGSEWAFKARPAQEGDIVEFDALTIDDILEQSGFPRIDVLKVDIEGAEESAFEQVDQKWLSKTRTLVIELHGDACERVVTTSLQSKTYERSTSGELTVFRNIIDKK